MRAEGQLVVISGFSGAGKGTVVKRLLERYPDDYALSVSMTTRAPRPGEVDGRDYFFVSEERFAREIAEGGLLEYAGYVGHRYGTPRRYVEEQRVRGRDVLLEIEVQGACQIRRIEPEAVLLFIAPPSAEALRERLAGRGTEDEEAVRGRLRQAVETEAPRIPEYDALLINEDLEECVQSVREAIFAARRAPARNRAFVEQLVADLRKQCESQCMSHCG